MEIDLPMRYQTPACDFYRKKLKELAEQGISKDGKSLDFTSFADRPTLEEGRKIPVKNEVSPQNMA
jgi:hypothetical protein